MSRRRRILSTEEMRLWSHVARQVAPLPGRALPPAPAEPAAPAPREPDPPAAAPAPAPKLTPVLKPLTALDRRERAALRRGRRDVDAVLDLHGMRQSEAHFALTAFLRQSQARGRSLVLVITGKGAAEAFHAGYTDERGVLRRMVPHWLRLPDLRTIVLGFEEAAQAHGGAGALYVRLRRRPGGGA